MVQGKINTRRQTQTEADTFWREYKLTMLHLIVYGSYKIF